MSIEFHWRPGDFNSLVEPCDRDTATPYILEYMPKSGAVLEAGCGLGRYVEFLSRRGCNSRHRAKPRDMDAVMNASATWVTCRCWGLDNGRCSASVKLTGSGETSMVLSMTHFLAGTRIPARVRQLCICPKRPILCGETPVESFISRTLGAHLEV